MFAIKFSSTKLKETFSHLLSAEVCLTFFFLFFLVNYFYPIFLQPSVRFSFKAQILLNWNNDCILNWNNF